MARRSAVWGTRLSLRGWVRGRVLLGIGSACAALILTQAASAQAFSVTGTVTYNGQTISIEPSGGAYLWSWSWPHFHGMTGTAHWSGNVTYIIEAGASLSSPTEATACGLVTTSNVSGAVGHTFQQFVEAPSKGMSVTAEYPSPLYQQIYQAVSGGSFFPSTTTTGCTSPNVFTSYLSPFIVGVTGTWTITP